MVRGQVLRRQFLVAICSNDSGAIMIRDTLFFQHLALLSAIGILVIGATAATAQQTNPPARGAQPPAAATQPRAGNAPATQPRKTTTPRSTPRTTPRANASPGQAKIPQPEDIALITTDGQQLRATFYEAAEAGKSTVPVLMLHGWQGRRSDYQALASSLQSAGHSCLAVDLRGHGDSILRVRTPAGIRTLEQADMRREHFAMMLHDVEAAKNFLLDKHNEGKVNIELLCLIAADMSSVVALNWTVHDWSWSQLPGYKQGQDVKALVLLSPTQTFEGYSSSRAQRHPFVQGRLPIRLSLMLIAGENDAEGSREVKRLHSSLSRFYPDPPAEQRAALQELFLITPPTSLEGTKLLGGRGLNVSSWVARFIHYRLVARRDQFPPWSERRSPL